MLNQTALSVFNYMYIREREREGDREDIPESVCRFTC